MTASLRYIECPTYWTPDGNDPTAVFLAGGISKVRNWQLEAIALFEAANVPTVVLNPRRRDSPPDLVNSRVDDKEQVFWEQHHLHLPDVITMLWFPTSDPALTTQPIAQFEYGQILNPATLASGRRFVVGADPGYPRRRDVELMMEYHRPDEPVFSTLPELVTATAEFVQAETAKPPAEVGIEHLLYAAAHGVHPSEVEDGDAGLEAVRQLVRFFSEQGAAAFSDAVGLPAGTSMEGVADWLLSRESETGQQTGGTQ